MLPYNKEYELKEGKYPGGTQEIAAGRAFFDAVGSVSYTHLDVYKRQTIGWW